MFNFNRKKRNFNSLTWHLCLSHQNQTVFLSLRKKKSLEWRATSTLSTKTHGQGKVLPATKGSASVSKLGNRVGTIARGERERTKQIAYSHGTVVFFKVQSAQTWKIPRYVMFTLCLGILLKRAPFYIQWFQSKFKLTSQINELRTCERPYHPPTGMHPAAVPFQPCLCVAESMGMYYHLRRTKCA